MVQVVAMVLSQQSIPGPTALKKRITLGFLVCVHVVGVGCVWFWLYPPVPEPGITTKIHPTRTPASTGGGSTFDVNSDPRPAHMWRLSFDVNSDPRPAHMWHLSFDSRFRPFSI